MLVKDFLNETQRPDDLPVLDSYNGRLGYVRIFDAPKQIVISLLETSGSVKFDSMFELRTILRYAHDDYEMDCERVSLTEDDDGYRYWEID